MFKPRVHPTDTLRDGRTAERDFVRTAELWLDDYKKYFYAAKAGVVGVAPGDMAAMLNVKKHLKCRPFKWLLDHIAPDVFVPSSGHVRQRGMLQGYIGRCVDKMGHGAGGVPGLYICHGKSSTQIWLFTSRFEIRTIDGLCLDYAGTSAGGDVVMQPCHHARGNQEWRFNLSGSKRIMHALSRLCLEVTPERQLRMMTCQDIPSQAWAWGHSHFHARPRP